MKQQGTNDDRQVLLEENRRLQSTVEELSILNEVATTISSAQTIDKIEYIIIKKCIKHLSVEEGVVMLFNEDDFNKPFQTILRTKNSILKSLHHTLDEQITNWILKNKTSLIINNFRDDTRFIKNNATKLSLRSLLCVPMYLKGRLFGIIALFNKITGEFTERDQRLLSILASQSAQVIENARLYEQETTLLKLEGEMSLASQIQNNLLPKEPIKTNGFTIEGKAVPAKDVGGDFFDFVSLPDNKIAVWLGDVAGKGMPAALLMANIQGYLRSRSTVDKNCKNCIDAVNEMMLSNSDDDKYATLFYAILDLETSQMSFVVAGHNNIIHFNKNKEIKIYESFGLPIGIYPTYNFEEKKITLNRGDLVLIYSDGITEAENNKEESFGEERLIDSIKKSYEVNSSNMIEKIYSEVKSFSQDIQRADDQTLLLIGRD
jgi:phosphoserine phosphatase RsbU/P